MPSNVRPPPVCSHTGEHRSARDRCRCRRIGKGRPDGRRAVGRLRRVPYRTTVRYLTPQDPTSDQPRSHIGPPPVRYLNARDPIWDPCSAPGPVPMPPRCEETVTAEAATSIGFACASSRVVAYVDRSAGDSVANPGDGHRVATFFEVANPVCPYGAHLDQSLPTSKPGPLWPGRKRSEAAATP